MDVLDVMRRIEGQTGMPKIVTRQIKESPSASEVAQSVDEIIKDLETMEQDVKLMRSRLIVVKEKINRMEGI